MEGDGIMTKSKNQMISKILLSYAFTFMMIELADSASMVIDGIIVSRHLGATQLAADGLSDPSFQMISLFCSIFAIGIQSSCSAAMGSGNREKTNVYFSSGIIIVSVIAAVVTILGFVCVEPLCRLFGADGSNMELFLSLKEYLRGWFVGIPGFMMFNVLSPLVTLDGNKKLVTAATVLQSVINVVGDYCAVTFLNMGIYGVGFFTGFGFDLAAILLILNFFRKRSAFRLSFVEFNFGAVFSMAKIGMPRLTKYGCKLLAPLLINRTVLLIGGSAAMAAMSVKASIGSFCLVAGNGIAESVNLMSQVFYSEKDRQSLLHTTVLAIKADVILCSIFAVILFSASKLLSGFYLTPGSAEYEMSVIMLRCFALSLMLNGINAIVLNYLQGTRKILPAHLQTASHRLIFLAISTFVLGKVFGINGIFVAIPLSELLVLLTYIIITLFSGKGKNHADALMLIPEDFGYNPVDCLEFSVTTIDEVVGISESISKFCSTHGIDRKRSYYASLCLEELADNVVEHGFKKDSKEHICDIRVMIEEGDVVLRIRDDCPYFNIKERYEAMAAKDKMANIGIKLVYGIAKDVNYVNLLNTNTLIIRV